MIGGCLLLKVATTMNALVVHKSSRTLRSFGKYLKLWNARLGEGSDAHFNDLSMFIHFRYTRYENSQYLSPPIWALPLKVIKIIVFI